jgi:hypothetical protein
MKQWTSLLRIIERRISSDEAVQIPAATCASIHTPIHTAIIDARHNRITFHYMWHGVSSLKYARRIGQTPSGMGRPVLD